MGPETEHALSLWTIFDGTRCFFRKASVAGDGGSARTPSPAFRTTSASIRAKTTRGRVIAGGTGSVGRVSSRFRSRRALAAEPVRFRALVEGDGLGLLKRLLLPGGCLDGGHSLHVRVGPNLPP